MNIPKEKSTYIVNFIILLYNLYLVYDNIHIL